MTTNLLPPNAAPWVPPVSVRESEEWLPAGPPEGRQKFKLQPWMIALLLILAAMIAIASGAIAGSMAEIRGERLGVWWKVGIVLCSIGSSTLGFMFFILSGEAWSAVIISLTIAWGELSIVHWWLTGAAFTQWW
jgi:hypothetical protein